MSQKDQGNTQSMRGEFKGHGRKPQEKMPEDMSSKGNRNTVGSSDGNGIRFPLHEHPDKSDLHSPEA